MEQKDREKTDYEKHLRYSSGEEVADGVSRPSDSAPNYGGAVIRTRGKEKRSTPIVAQSGFDSEDEPMIEFQTNTGQKLKRLTPIEEEGRQSTQGFMPPETVRRANKQRHAINKGNARRQK